MTMTRRRIPLARWLGLGWLFSVAAITVALLLGSARQNALLAYVEQYGETAQLRMSDVDHLLDRRLAFWVDCDLSWLPGGRTIFYTRTRPGEQHQIIQLDVYADTVTFRTSGGTHNEAPAVSPDGTLLAFAANHDTTNDIMLLDLRSGVQRVLARVPLWVSRMRWLPDGERIVVYGIQDNRFARTYVIYVPTGGVFRVVNESAANWSPDREYLAYVQTDADPGLYITDRTSGEPQHISDQPVLPNLPVWAPDGHSLVFVSGEDEGQRLALFDLPSDEVRWLTPPLFADVGQIAWSSDGARIAFSARGHNENRRYNLLTPYDIYTVSRAGGDVRRVRQGFGTYINNFSRFCALGWQP